MGTESAVVALTGGSGFLGSHIADALLGAGCQVRVAVRSTSDLRWLADKPLATVLVDLNDSTSCADFLAGTSAVVHCAGAVSAADEAGYRLANVASTIRLLDAAERVWSADSGATFLLISSLAAHGPAPLSRPAVESDPCRPITAYGRSKLLAERALMTAPGHFRRVILRPPSLYGPRDREFLPLLRAATRGWTVRLGRSLTGLSLVDGRDAAAAAVALLTTAGTEGAYFVDDGHLGYDWEEIRAALAAAAGRSLRRLEVPMPAIRTASAVTAIGRRLCGSRGSLLLTADRVRDLAAPGWVCDGGRLAAAAGLAPCRNLTDGFAETQAFYREHGWL